MGRSLTVILSAFAISMAAAAFGIAKAVEPQPQPTPSAIAAEQTTPQPSTSPSASPSPQAVDSCELIGKFQREVEQALSTMGNFGVIKIDGTQTAGDCATIKRFQTRFGLKPVDGVAGPGTHGVAQRLLASDPDRCDASGWGITACVDLTNQTTWLMSDREVIHGPTVTRTGMKKFATPTGEYEVQWKAIKDWSEPYKVWLPYWQGFNDGIGFHETTSYLHNPAIGSHGCINLLHEDAQVYWDELDEGSSVVVFGHRSGT